MEQLNRTPYEAPMILDTFDALEVMGSAEGLIVIGQGSQAAGRRVETIEAGATNTVPSQERL